MFSVQLTLFDLGSLPYCLLQELGHEVQEGIHVQCWVIVWLGGQERKGQGLDRQMNEY